MTRLHTVPPVSVYVGDARDLYLCKTYSGLPYGVFTLPFTVYIGDVEDLHTAKQI